MSSDLTCPLSFKRTHSVFLARSLGSFPPYWIVAKIVDDQLSKWKCICVSCRDGVDSLKCLEVYRRELENCKWKRNRILEIWCAYSFKHSVLWMRVYKRQKKERKNKIKLYLLCAHDFTSLSSRLVVIIIRWIDGDNGDSKHDDVDDDVNSLCITFILNFHIIHHIY